MLLLLLLLLLLPPSSLPPQRLPQPFSQRLPPLAQRRDVLGAHADALARRQRLCQPDGVLDLAAVELIIGERRWVELADPCRAEQVCPHLGACRLAERLVPQRDRDARVEGVVKGADAIGSEKQDTLMVLEEAKEDAHHRVAVDVVLRAPLEEDVRLVDENNRVPRRRDLEDLAQLLLELGARDAELANAELIPGRADGGLRILSRMDDAEELGLSDLWT